MMTMGDDDDDVTMVGGDDERTRAVYVGCGGEPAEYSMVVEDVKGWGIVLSSLSLLFLQRAVGGGWLCLVGVCV